MKKLIFLLIIINTQVSAQNTWFKLLSGFRAQTNFFLGDTLMTVGSGNYGPAINININYSNLKTGNLYHTDSLDYFEISNDSFTTNEYRKINQSVYDKITRKLTLGFNYIDTLRGKYKWQSAIFNAYPLKKLSYQLNHDTFNTKIEGYQKIGNNYYAIVWWENRLNASSAKACYKLLKLNDDFSTTLIKEQINSSSCADCHSFDFDKLHGDNQNQNNLFLEMSDEWDWAGGPASWQIDIVKLDLTGKTLWKCRPNNRDSVNTTAFQMVQKPNGNIICSWNDFYHPPHKHPTIDSDNQQVNDSSTIWLAEIDYLTGKVLWRKNLRRYLFSQFTPTKNEKDNKTYQAVFFVNAVMVNENCIVWAGFHEKSFPNPVGWKRLAVLFKTDILGNPIWFREHEIFPGDSCDKGMEVFSFIQTPDKGFILAGGHLNIPEQTSDCEYWQKAAILKLDSFGCWKEGCQITDGIKKLTNSPKICKVYPNPANNKLFIEFPPNLPNGWRFTITDILGKNIKLLNDQAVSIDITNYSSGLYFIHLHNVNSKQNETHKISIEH